MASVFLQTEGKGAFPWGGLAAVFLFLLLFWIAIWKLDFSYYQLLLQGAVVALLELEEETAKGNTRVSEINLSTRVEQVVKNDKQLKQPRRTRNGRIWFYALVAGALAVGLLVSSSLMYVNARTQSPAQAAPAEPQ